MNTATVRFPGARCGDPLLFAKLESIPPLSDHVEKARTLILGILEGRVDSRTHAVKVQPAEAAVLHGAELENGQIKPKAADAATAA